MSCSSSSEGGNIYAKAGSIAYYRICAAYFPFSVNKEGAFSYSFGSQGTQYLNMMNESCLAKAGSIDNGNSFDYRYYGKQIYKSNNCSFCKSSYDMYQFYEDPGYTLELSYSYLANTTTKENYGIYLYGSFSFIKMIIIGNKVTNTQQLFGAYSSLNFDSCIVLDNTNPGTFVKPGVTMTNCKYNGHMTNVQINSQSNDLNLDLSLLSTWLCQALKPINKNKLNKMNECTNIIINQNYTNYHVLLLIIFMIE